MGWATLVTGGAGISIYGSALWSFFNDIIHRPPPGTPACSFNPSVSNICQLNMAQILAAPRDLRWFNLNTLGAANMVLDGAGVQATKFFNPGSWQAVIAAYLRRAGLGPVGESALQKVVGEL